jgi:hypothetical protein
MPVRFSIIDRIAWNMALRSASRNDAMIVSASSGWAAIDPAPSKESNSCFMMNPLGPVNR